MSPREANVLLTKIALLDGRFKRTPEEQAQMAVAWAEVLAEVALNAAIEAVTEHYAAETRGIMPADIVEACPVRSSSWVGNVTEQRLAAEAAGRVKALEPGHDGR